MVEQKFFTVGQVAEKLSVNPQTVRRWIDRGEITAVNIGREYRIAESDLQEFIESRRGLYVPRSQRVEAGGLSAPRERDPVLVDGQAVKRAKEASGLTVRELSKITNVSESRLYSIFSAPSRGIYVERGNLKAITEALGVESEILLKER